MAARAGVPAAWLNGCGGGDLRNTTWRQKDPMESPEPQLWLKQERFTDKPSHRLVNGAFSKPLLPPSTPTHAQNPKPPCVSTAIRVIADYTHNCLAKPGPRHASIHGGLADVFV